MTNPLYAFDLTDNLSLFSAVQHLGIFLAIWRAMFVPTACVKRNKFALNEKTINGCACAPTHDRTEGIRRIDPHHPARPPPLLLFGQLADK